MMRRLKQRTERGRTTLFCIVETFDNLQLLVKTFEGLVKNFRGSCEKLLRVLSKTFEGLVEFI